MEIEISEKEQALKAKLQKIKDNGWKFDQDINFYEFTLELIENIKSIDQELRENLIIQAVLTIIDDEELSIDELKTVLKELSGEHHLFDNIGAENDDSVFNRAASLVLINAILEKNFSYEEGFLSDDEISGILKDIKFYSKAEKDFRGYVENRGWAYVPANVSDIFSLLVAHDSCDHKKIDEIFEILKNFIESCEYSYVNGEDEHFAQVLIEIYDSKLLDNDDLINWIYSFGEFEDFEEDIKNERLKHNKKMFFRSLYFKFKEKELPIEFIYSVEGMLLDL